MFILVDFLHTEAIQVRNRCPQPYSLCNRGSAGFKFVRQGCESGVLQEDVSDHLTATHEWWHLLKYLFLAVQKPYASGCTHLVTGCYQPVTIKILARPNTNSMNEKLESEIAEDVRSKKVASTTIQSRSDQSKLGHYKTNGRGAKETIFINTERIMIQSRDRSYRI